MAPVYATSNALTDEDTPDMPAPLSTIMAAGLPLIVTFTIGTPLVFRT
ncbi:hypothetical protein [Acetobacter sacchari]|nr:hypothetical protein [Acetobacter sacchari]